MNLHTNSKIRCVNLNSFLSHPLNGHNPYTALSWTINVSVFLDTLPHKR